MRLIAEQAGIEAGGIYCHLARKKELVAAVMEPGANSIVQHIKNMGMNIPHLQPTQLQHLTDAGEQCFAKLVHLHQAAELDQCPSGTCSRPR